MSGIGLGDIDWSSRVSLSSSTYLLMLDFPPINWNCRSLEVINEFLRVNEITIRDSIQIKTVMKQKISSHAFQDVTSGYSSKRTEIRNSIEIALLCSQQPRCVNTLNVSQ